MFGRKIRQNLDEWRRRPGRKPLVIRGARQTGKTTLVRQFAEGFENFVELNLEKDAARRIFTEVKDIGEVIQSIEGVANRRIVPGRTLLFIDEIQNSVSAIKLLRYFHEEAPDLHVIAAGSLLEVRMRNEGWSFPVGRVEFLYIYPVSFDEFLSALGEGIVLQLLEEYAFGRNLPAPVHEKLVGLVVAYMAVGGMPEAVEAYRTTKSFAEVRRCHEALNSSFKEDFAKYSKESAVEYLKTVWDKVPFESGSRIKYTRIAGPDARSRGIVAAFDILHEAMLVERVFPTTQTTLPFVRKPKAAPKAQFLDIGLCTHVLGLTSDQIRERLISGRFSGGLAETFVGQELLAMDLDHRRALFFWIREEKDASSELDFVLQIGSDIVPVEVKSGGHGSLKSLHQFLNRGSLESGIRISNGPPGVERQVVNFQHGGPLRYRLLSIPFYLVFRLAALWEQAKA